MLSKDMYWAIGLFEGEGSIITGKYGRSKFGHVNLIIQMTDKDVLQRFYKVVKVGNFRGPYRSKQYKRYWTWACGTSIEVIKLLTLWLPILGRRRRNKAKEAIRQAKKSVAWMKAKNRCCKNGHNWSHYSLVASNGTRRCLACYNNWRANNKQARKE